MFKPKRRARKTDFTIENLPSNRFQLFFDVIKNNWRPLLLIGLFLTISILPIAAINFYFDTVNYSFYNDFQTGKITEEVYLQYYNLNILLNGCFSALAVLVVTIPLAGLMKIIKRMVFLDPVFFKDDFISGIKENGFLYFCIGINVAIFIALDSLILILNTSNILKGIGIGVSFLFIFPILLIMMAAVPIYKLKFWSGWLNCFKIFIKYFPLNILMTALMLAPLAFSFINIIAVKYIVGIVFCLIFGPYMLVGLFDYCCFMFDKVINKDMFPKYYRKGLSNPNINKQIEKENIIENNIDEKE